MANENVSDKTTSKPEVDDVSAGQNVDEGKYKEMLDILKDLTDHTHIFYDDYGTACNCACACTCCVRGMVWAIPLFLLSFSVLGDVLNMGSGIV